MLDRWHTWLGYIYVPLQRPYTVRACRLLYYLSLRVSTYTSNGSYRKVHLTVLFVSSIVILTVSKDFNSFIFSSFSVDLQCRLLVCTSMSMHVQMHNIKVPNVGY